jgi:hypothetical protein
MVGKAIVFGIYAYDIYDELSRIMLWVSYGIKFDYLLSFGG